MLPSWATDLLDRVGLRDLADVQAKLSNALGKGTTFFAAEALDIGLGTINFVVSFAIMLYLLYFFVRDGEALTRRITHAIPLPPDQQHALVAKSIAVIRATFKGNLLVAAVQGALGGLIFRFLGINAPVLWAVVMALCSLLPAVGAAIVWVPVAIYFLATGSVWQGVVLLAYGAFVMGLVDNLLRPRLVGKERCRTILCCSPPSAASPPSVSAALSSGQWWRRCSSPCGTSSRRRGRPRTTSVASSSLPGALGKIPFFQAFGLAICPLTSPAVIAASGGAGLIA